MVKFTAWLDLVIEKLLMLLMIFIVASVSWQVLSRYLLHEPSSVSEEIARFLLIWISMIGAVYCYRTKAHLGLDILTNKMKPQQQQQVELFSHLVVFIFSAFVLIVGGCKLVQLSFDPVQISPALSLPMGLVYLVMPITGVLFCFYAVVESLTLKNSKTVNEGIK
ncbi:Tripartite ATP-independent periplasmic transporter DctQ component [Colwellia psychrerythraea]|uniref:TRAP transporter small permease protein n=2 Tax=Colwellia psychrerythraea TaxID=28229 RepID=A0A099KD45_COLPS|nr:Tripartite ATP-independent periplasmic transporter DctQ component [Colwellia psychrerythraea]